MVTGGGLFHSEVVKIKVVTVQYSQYSTVQYSTVQYSRRKRWLRRMRRRRRQCVGELQFILML